MIKVLNKSWFSSSWPCVHAVHCIILYFVKGDNMVIKVQKCLDVVIIDETVVVFYLEFS
jgi:hypothetical protein